LNKLVRAAVGGIRRRPRQPSSADLYATQVAEQPPTIVCSATTCGDFAAVSALSLGVFREKLGFGEVPSSSISAGARRATAAMNRCENRQAREKAAREGENADADDSERPEEAVEE